MKAVPNSIKNKLQSYSNHIQKSEKLRHEIEAWLLSNDINTNIDSDDLNGKAVTDIIIDTGMYGDIEGAVILIEEILNEK